MVVGMFGCTPNVRSTRFTTDFDCEILERNRLVVKHSRQPKMNRLQTNTIAKLRVVKESATETKVNVYPVPFQATNKLLTNLSPPSLPPLVYPSSTPFITSEQKSNSFKKTLPQLTRETQPFSAAEHTFEKSESDWQLLLLFGAPIAFSLAGLYFFYPQVSRVSAWAAHHPKQTQAMLFGAHVFSMASSYYVGHLLFEESVLIPSVFAAAGFAGFTMASLLYPTTHSATLENLRGKYLNQKFYDVFIVASGLTLMTYAGNHQFSLTLSPITNQYVTSYQQNIGSVKMQATVPVVKQEDPPKKNGKIALTILASFLFAVLILGVTVLGCALVCEGQTALAALVFFGGATGLIAIFVNVLKSISKKYKVKRREKAAPTSTPQVA